MNKFQKLKQRRKEREVSLGIINLIDIMLVLLIFFMATTTFITVNDAINLNLPNSNIINETKTKEIVVSVTNNKEIYINGQKVIENSFENELEKIMKKINKDVVLIKGDKNLSYGYLVHIMALAKNSGAKQLDIATVPEKNTISSK